MNAWLHPDRGWYRPSPLGDELVKLERKDGVARPCLSQGLVDGTDPEQEVGEAIGSLVLSRPEPREGRHDGAGSEGRAPVELAFRLLERDAVFEPDGHRVDAVRLIAAVLMPA